MAMLRVVGRLAFGRRARSVSALASMTPDAIRDAVEKIVESESLSMDAPWPDLHCKAKVLGRCIDELEADIPSRVLANLKNANDVVETLTEQAHAVVKTNTKRELPPNLTVE